MRHELTSRLAWRAVRTRAIAVRIVSGRFSGASALIEASCGSSMLIVTWPRSEAGMKVFARNGAIAPEPTSSTAPATATAFRTFVIFIVSHLLVQTFSDTTRH